MVILYNQEKRKIVNIFDGLVSQQHDIDVLNLDPLKISIFDNNIQRDNKKINLYNPSENNISYGNKIIFLENFNTDLNRGKLINLIVLTLKNSIIQELKKLNLIFLN